MLNGVQAGFLCNMFYNKTHSYVYKLIAERWMVMLPIVKWGSPE